MKKYICNLTLFLFGVFAFSQIPNGYYDNATGTGYALKTQLKTIISTGHSAQGYGNLWNLYKNYTGFKDIWYENDGTILDVYSENPTGQDSYEFTPGTNQCGSYTGEGVCYNKEHIVPQNAGFNTGDIMGNDAFHIWPTDGYVNGKRSNYPHGKVGSATWTSQNGSKLGPASNIGYAAGYSGIVFEPIDEFKGDIARAYFYFATRYEDSASSLNYDMFDHSTGRYFTEAFKNILIEWNAMDPVSPKEIAMNNSIYSYQGNRNPYIDHPEWVTTIWGTGLNSEDIQYQDRDYLEIYPTLVANSVFTVKSKADDKTISQILIFNMNGIKVYSQENSSKDSEIKVNINLPAGVYIVKVLGRGMEVNRKIIVK